MNQQQANEICHRLRDLATTLESNGEATDEWVDRLSDVGRDILQLKSGERRLVPMEPHPASFDLPEATAIATYVDEERDEDI